MTKEFSNTKASIDSILSYINQNNISFIEFRFIDLFGNNFRILKPVKMINYDSFVEGFTFDGSSIDGWKNINNSDTLAMPDASSYFIDEFASMPTLVIFCYIMSDCGVNLYNRDPKTVAFRAQKYLQTLGIADVAYFGPELEFFIFDSFSSKISSYETNFVIDSVEMKGKNAGTGYEIAPKTGYFATTPRDSMGDIMIDMVNSLENAGLTIELFHREVATAQAEIGFKYSDLMGAATNCYIYKNVVKNVAQNYGKTATFMPKPIFGDNGSGMHVHQSLWKDGKNLFIGDSSCGLSEMALYYIGGIIKHGKALNAFCNPTTNSYKRLVPGFEAPVILAYSECNRSASIRIPKITTPNAKRIEVRFPDPSANSFLAMSAMLMAGLDGIKNKIKPGEETNDNLYELPDEQKNKYPVVSGSLNEALNELNNSRSIFTVGGVFTDDLIDSFIKYKTEEARYIDMIPTPIEFEKYYSC